MQVLKKQMKQRQFHNTYLFYGEEIFLLQTYLKNMKMRILSDGDVTMNYDVYEEEFDGDQFLNAVQTMPFLNTYRLIVVKQSKLFQPGKKNKTDKLVEGLKSIPESTIVIFVEDAVDKRNKLYKLIKNNGYITVFNPLGEKDLIQYIARELHKDNKRIEQQTARYLIQTVGNDLNIINNEVQKLVQYCLKETIITKKAVDMVCTPSLENRIFELVGCMGQKKRDRAIKLYHDLIISKEPPIRILIMLVRQFRLILQASLLRSRGLNVALIAKEMKAAPFVVKECLKQGGAFNTKQLKEALTDCLDTDYKIKTGRLDGKIGVEVLIIKYS